MCWGFLNKKKSGWLPRLNFNFQNLIKKQKIIKNFTVMRFLSFSNKKKTPAERFEPGARSVGRSTW
jgi:hypothetical protein